MDLNPSLVSQALAFRADTCKMAKKMTAFCGMESNAVEDEGVVYEGDENGTTHFRFYYPNAKSVVVKTNASELALTKGDDGVWSGTGHYSIGFQNTLLFVDGQEVANCYLPFTYSFSRPLNYIDVPPPDMSSCVYAMRLNTEYGAVSTEFFVSSKGTPEKLLIYLPPSYRKEANGARRYPVLYLQHGVSDNENGWVYAGKVNHIADNLIADAKMTDMIIVMGNGMRYTDDGAVDVYGYLELLVEDIIPYIDNRYRTRADRDNRAIAGLSMGSMQATRLSITRPDLFSYVGIFSGFLRSGWSDIGSEDSHIDVLRKDPAAYRKAMKLIYRAIGDVDFLKPIFEEDNTILAEVGIEDDVRVIFNGAHTWQVWRLCAIDFLPRLFQH